MDLLAFVLALQAEGKTAEEVRAAVNQYLEDNPGAIDQAAVEAILDGRLDEIEDDLGGLKSALEPAATSADVGKVMMVKAVENGKVAAWELAEVSGTAFPSASGVNF